MGCPIHERSSFCTQTSGASTRYWQSMLRRHLLHRRPDRRTYPLYSSFTAQSVPSTSLRPSSQRPRAASTASARCAGRCTARPRSLLESQPPSPVWRLPVRFSVERIWSFLRLYKDMFGRLFQSHANQVTKPEVRERYIHLCFLNYVRYCQLTVKL